VLLDRVRTWVGLVAQAPKAFWYAGMLRPVRPDRAARLLAPYRRYGAVPATVGAIASLRFPKRTAIIDEQGSLTYEQLEHHADALATALRDRLKDRERIGILCRNHRGFVESVLAASRTGHDVVLLNTGFSGPQLGQVVERESVGLLIHDEEFDPVVDKASYKGRRVHAWQDGTTTPYETLDDLLDTTPAKMHPDRHSKVILMTSGTTGTPKGARSDITLRTMLPVALSHMMRIPVRSGAPMVVGPPLFHVLGFAYLSAGLALGTPIVLFRRFEPEQVLDAIKEHRVDTLVAVPVMLQRLLDALDGSPPPSLRVVVCGGSALHPHLSEAFMDAFGDIIHNLYGATETGWATIATPQDAREAPGTVGRPSFLLTIKILDAEGRELPTGEIGEIHTSGGFRFTGYTGGGSRQTRNGLYSTGDMGHFDAKGRLFVDGRADDMIVSGGENVFPAEVENLLGAHPDVADVSVTGVEDERFGQRLAAYVVRAQDSTITGDDLKDHVRTHLARYKVPRDIHFVDELPRTPTGKIKRPT
jgi:acyl-CoA synthetase (AMP-forming)/AMP-acid ligase II